MQGYEIFAIDMRGHGDSGGERGIFPSFEDLYNDEWMLILEACKKYEIDHLKTPLFLLGRSFGGLLSTMMIGSEIGRKMFAGAILISPFYNDYKGMTTKLNAVYRPLAKVFPKMKFSAKEKASSEYETEHSKFYKDPRHIRFVTTKTLSIVYKE